MKNNLAFLFVLAIVWISFIGVENLYHHIYFNIISVLIVYIFSLRYFDISWYQFSKILKFTSYLIWIIPEIIKSSITLSYIIWQNNINIKTKFYYIPCHDLSEYERFIYATSITLTPGTITTEIDNNHLIIHAIDNDYVINGIQGFKKKIFSYR